jgi:hypothetical protein
MLCPRKAILPVLKAKVAWCLTSPRNAIRCDTSGCRIHAAHLASPVRCEIRQRSRSKPVAALHNGGLPLHADKFLRLSGMCGLGQEQPLSAAVLRSARHVKADVRLILQFSAIWRLSGFTASHTPNPRLFPGRISLRDVDGTGPERAPRFDTEALK